MPRIDGRIAGVHEILADMFHRERQAQRFRGLPVERCIGQPFRRSIDLVAIDDRFRLQIGETHKRIGLVRPADIALQRQRVRDIECRRNFHTLMARGAVRNIEAIAVAEEEVLLVHPVGGHIEDKPSVYSAAARAHFNTVQPLGIDLANNLQVLQSVKIGHLRRPLAACIVHVIADIAR